jgi:HlyD family secretion protein
VGKKLLRPRLAIPLAALFLFFFGGWTLRNKLAADRQGEWVRATRGDLVSGVDVTGTLAATVTVSLGPPQVENVWDFKISMLAPEGTDVRTGRPVLAFDSSELQRRLEEFSATSEQAKKQIEKKRSDLAIVREDEKLTLADAQARMRKLALKLDAPPDLIGNKERRQAELDYKLAEREVRATQSRIADLERAAAAEIRFLESKQQQAANIVMNAQKGIASMTVLAPRDGTVVYVTNWRGEKKKVGDTCWRMERVIEIPDTSRMMARGEVDEVDAGRVAVGQRVSLRLDAHPDEELHGTIIIAGRTVQQRQGTKNPVKALRVDVALDKTDPASMRPGMRFQGTVELARVRNAILIPRNAVFLSDDGRPIVYRRGALAVEKVPLRLGKENDKLVEVLSGLAPDDRVLLNKSSEDEKKGGA